MRAFINRFLRWPPVTDLDRDKMGIRNWNTIRTPKLVPATVTEIKADSSVIRQLSLRMRNHGTTTWGKPEHVHGSLQIILFVFSHVVRPPNYYITT